ncbi:autotransporter outer membrane beta-barrel domain-containing protein [Amorphus coralli]|uniref:autotransporter outer membrane beta-barrel domain-containing protein n=1 Tax=Amorphus coralli TaxID=340680 RepID=UPI00035F2899|nr:autotransporter domain-containing protein [Amorphus coralli]
MNTAAKTVRRWGIAGALARELKAAAPFGAMAIAFLLPILVAAPATAQTWSLYDNGGVSYAIDPVNTLQDRFKYDISVAPGGGDSRSVTVEMDTGSTGIVVSAHLISHDVSALQGEAGWAYYNSSGLLATGVLVDSDVTYRTTDGGTITASVPVLAVTGLHCLGVGDNSANCNENQTITMMGVGFGRNTLGEDPDGSIDAQASSADKTVRAALAGSLRNAGTTSLAYNPLIHVEARGDATLNQGYIIRDGKIEVGLTASNTGGFAYGKLSQATAADGSGNWTQTPMAVQVGTVGPTSGLLLADTGVTDGFVHLPGARQSGAVPADTVVTVQVLDAGDLVSYSFTVGTQCAQNSPPSPCNPQGPSSISYVRGEADASFLNTSIYFYQGFSYLFDPTNGYVGVANAMKAGTNVVVTPVISASGQIDFADPFTTDMPVFLRNASMIAAADTATFNAALTGPGSLTLNGAGTVTLNGANSYSGATIVQSGTLAVTRSLASAVTVQSGATFDLSGTLAVSGTSAPVVTVDSGGFFDLTGSVTGDVSNAGTFTHNGTLSGTLTSTGRVQGTGTVATLFIADGGTLATGNSVGTMTVTGNYTFGPGATREVEIEAGGSIDLLEVGGIATLAGGTVDAVENPAFVPILGESYAFLRAAGGISGTHDTLEGGLFPDATYPFLTTGLAYSATEAALEVVRSGVTYESAGITDNQKSVGAALDTFVPDSALDLPLTHLTASQYDVAADQLSGQIYASALTTLQNDATIVRDTIRTRLGTAFAEMADGSAFAANGAPAAPLAGLTASAWISGFGSWGDTEASFNAAELTTSLAGTLAGLDASVHHWGRVGLAAGYGSSRFKAADLSTSGTAGSATIAAYGGAEIGSVRASLGGTWSWHDVETNRVVSFPGYYEADDADYSATTGQIFGEGAVNLGFAPVDLEAFAGLAFVSTSTGSFTEGTGLTALSSSGNTQSNTLSTLGVRIAKVLPLGGGWVRPHATLGWQHAFGDVEPEADLAFAQSGAGFTVIGAPIARDAAVYGIGLDFAAFDSAELSVRYDGRIGSGTQEHSASGQLSFTF